MTRRLWRNERWIERGIWITLFIGIISLTYWGNGNHLAMEVPYQDPSLVAKMMSEKASLQRKVQDYRALSLTLEGQVKALNANLNQYEQQLRAVKMPIPTREILHHDLSKAIHDEKGFRHETKRILGDLMDVSAIRVR